MTKKILLSQRVRPNSEAAPWVIEEIKELEAKNTELEATLERVRCELSIPFCCDSGCISRYNRILQTLEKK